MKKIDFLTKIVPRLIIYKLQYYLKLGRSLPITLTFSVTAACQSRCKTCNIGKLWLEDPKRSIEDLNLEEIEKIFMSIGPVYFFNISGGEPFLRKDLADIVELACKYLKPRVIHTPTNAIQPDVIHKETKRILEIIKRYDPSVPFTVKPSIDGIGERHDEIRGVKGNFINLEKTIMKLKELEIEYSNFHLELGTVVSNFNIDHLGEVEDFVHSLNVESYRNEVAEQRQEFFNIGDSITPNSVKYIQLMDEFSKKILKNIHKKRALANTTEALRLVYYNLAGKILEENKQILPCYAGISNVHINYNGGVWPCCVLGYSKEMGNLREYNYDFKKLWNSNKAKGVRRYIKDKNCACPLANQAYSNILLNIRYMVKAIKYIVQFKKIK